MLNLVNILTLSTALTLQPITNTITITTTQVDNTINFNSVSTLEKENKYTYAFAIFLYTETDKTNYIITTFDNYNSTATATQKANINKIAISGPQDNYDISKYNTYNQTETIKNYPILSNTIQDYKGAKQYTFTIKIRSTTFMEELLTALTTAVQSAVSIFVEGFGGLTQIFYNGTEITFIGGILIVGLAVMFLMMFLRWIVSFVKGI